MIIDIEAIKAQAIAQRERIYTDVEKLRQDAGKAERALKLVGLIVPPVVKSPGK